MSDESQSFLFVHRAVRGAWARCDALMHDVLQRHPYPAALQALLGDLMIACAMLSAHLKDGSTLTLQLRGSGPLHLAMAECSAAGHIRVYADYDADRLHPQLSFMALLAPAQMALTLEHEGQSYQGIVALHEQGLALSLEDYFLQSEQLPSCLLLAHRADRYAGLLLQQMPAADRDQADEDFRYARLLAQTCRDDELLELDSSSLLQRLYHEDDITLAPPQTLSFHCRCSRQRSLSALLSLGAADLSHLLMERHGRIEVDCELCRQRYHFSSLDLSEHLQASDSLQ